MGRDVATRRLTAFLDTHAAVFLWEGRIELFGSESRALLESADLRVSPIVGLELKFLEEIGRLKVGPARILRGLSADLGVVSSADVFEHVVAHAVGVSWTRDPFDRIIAATAMLHRSPLVTRDRIIRQHYDRAVW
jgi:PIN domain nuclease of toxin-antitoxin system